MSKQAEMIAEWRSWEYLITEDVKRLENRIQCCYGGMAAQSIPRDMREEFVLTKLREIILKVTSKGA